MRSLSGVGGLRRRRLIPSVRLLACAVMLGGLLGPAPAAYAVEPSPEAADLLARVNALRSRMGLPTLVADPELAAEAKSWAAQMAAAGKISHNPRLSPSQARARKLAENVAVGPDIGRIHDALVASPTHYRNLVDPDVRRAGIAVVPAKGSLWTVQNFAQPLPDGGSAPRPRPPARPTAPPAPPPETVMGSSLDRFGPGGVAEGVAQWGETTLSPLAEPPLTGGQAQRVQVEKGSTGGVWLVAKVSPGVTYRQSILLRVEAMEPGAQVELILEWFDAGGRMLGYALLPLPEAGSGPVRVHQEAQAPAGTDSVRFVVNLKGGGTYVLDEAILQTVTSSRPR